MSEGNSNSQCCPVRKILIEYTLKHAYFCFFHWNHFLIAVKSVMRSLTEKENQRTMILIIIFNK